MTLIWDVEDFPDDGYVVNYTCEHGSGDRKVIHMIRIANGVLKFIECVEVNRCDDHLKIDESGGGGAEYTVSQYANQYAMRENDIHFLLSDEEVLMHIVTEAI